MATQTLNTVVMNSRTEKDYRVTARRDLYYAGRNQRRSSRALEQGHDRGRVPVAAVDVERADQLPPLRAVAIQLGVERLRLDLRAEPGGDVDQDGAVLPPGGLQARPRVRGCDVRTTSRAMEPNARASDGGARWR